MRHRRRRGRRRRRMKKRRKRRRWTRRRRRRREEGGLGRGGEEREGAKSMGIQMFLRYVLIIFLSSSFYISVL